MKISIKAAALFAAFVIGAVAGPQGNLNFTGWDTASCKNWAADSFRVSKAFNLTNAENKLAIFLYDDTVNAGRADSVVCELGYQLGAPIINFAGVQDTVWSATIAIDTLNTVTSAKKFNPLQYVASSWSIDRSTENSTRVAGQADTTIGTSSGAIMLPFVPLWAPYVRLYAKGLTGNTAHTVKAKWILEQRAWINVKTY